MDTVAVLLMPVLFLFIGLFSRRYSVVTRSLIITIVIVLLLFLYLR